MLRVRDEFYPDRVAGIVYGGASVLSWGGAFVGAMFHHYASFPGAFTVCAIVVAVGLVASQRWAMIGLLALSFWSAFGALMTGHFFVLLWTLMTCAYAIARLSRVFGPAPR